MRVREAFHFFCGGEDNVSRFGTESDRRFCQAIASSDDRQIVMDLKGTSDLRRPLDVIDAAMSAGPIGI